MPMVVATVSVIKRFVDVLLSYNNSIIFVRINNESLFNHAVCRDAFECYLIYDCVRVCEDEYADPHLQVSL